ncbi:MAG: hypothetical protein MJ056_03370 [Akkermansia sp.]|nr:hypothetical protein [Akkermansia sp.]
MPEENLPPIPVQEQQASIVWGVLAVVGSLFCWIAGLIFSIIGLCKYRKGSAGRVLSWIGLVIFIVITAATGYVTYVAIGATREAMENIQRDHPEFTEQQLLEYMRDPANKAEIKQYTQESVNAAFGI